MLGEPKSIPPDQAATEFGERAVNVGTVLETNTEASEVMPLGDTFVFSSIDKGCVEENMR